MIFTAIMLARLPGECQLDIFFHSLSLENLEIGLGSHCESSWF